ncbi:MAG: GGDEF domain-containing protein [Proteobacteria bacterium]|nr:GGDEF domain-containing protein [Pseudomonadota bacterium]
MLRAKFSSLWVHSWSKTLNDIGANEMDGLFRAKRHITRLTVPRAATIVARVRIVAGLLAVFTPLWILIDIWTLPTEVWHDMMPMRLLAAVAFVAILLALRGMHTLGDAYRALSFLLSVPSALFLYGYLRIMHHDADGVIDGFAVGYASLPFVMMSGIAIFPLTILEGVVFCFMILLVQIAAWVPHLSGMQLSTVFGTLWVLLMLAAASTLAGVSQLAFMIVMVREGIHDSLTGCYSRRAGEALVDLQYTWSVRSDTPLVVAIVSLDDFQDVNERFGYAAGDAALKAITERLNDSLRAGDILARWAGDQYMLALANSTTEQGAEVVGRLLAGSLGTKPDGTPFTASIGLAERVRDATEDWWRLIDTAEARSKAAHLAAR